MSDCRHYFVLVGCAHGVDAGVELTLSRDLDHPASLHAGALDIGDLWQNDCVVSGSADGGDVRIATPESGAASVLLVGAPASTEVRAHATCGDVDGPEAVITTGEVPSSIGTLELVTPLTASIDEEWILTSTISDVEGRPVWWEDTGLNLVTSARYDTETNSIYGISSGISTNVDVLLVAHLAGPTERFPVENGHHESLALGDGRFLVTATVFETTSMRQRG
ncbi:MAG: hypothetical protein EXR69_06185 [Myxococcales bacterium]|nr:hypothetical protein [Myxococcales bacterium]